MIRILYILIALLILQSCASFDKEVTNSYPLSKDNLSELNGQYEIAQIDYDTVFKRFKRQMWTGNNFFKQIDRKLLKDTINLDSLKTYKVGLTILSEKSIKVSYIENDQIFRERILKAKLKKDGYFYLKNKNTGFLLIPYVAGAIDIKRTRLGKSKSGNLIFDVSNHRSGAFLIVAFLDGRTWKRRFEYKKLK